MGVWGRRETLRRIITKAGGKTGGWKKEETRRAANHTRRSQNGLIVIA